MITVNWRVADAAEAVTVALPTFAGDRETVLPWPLASVVSTTVSIEPPPLGTLQRTGTFGSGEPSAFMMEATSGVDALLPASSVCESPDTMFTDAGTDGPSFLSPQAPRAAPNERSARLATARASGDGGGRCIKGLRCRW